MTTAELVATMREQADELGVPATLFDAYDPTEPECPEFHRLLAAVYAALQRRRQAQEPS